MHRYLRGIRSLLMVSEEKDSQPNHLSPCPRVQPNISCIKTAHSRGNKRQRDQPVQLRTQLCALLVKHFRHRIQKEQRWRALLAALVRAREIDSLAVFGVSATLEWSRRAGGLLRGELVRSREVDIYSSRVAAVFGPAEGWGGEESIGFAAGWV